jgi:predicted Zn-dependent peptidase
MSAWIDAGARDADPPALATVAAWAASAGTEVRARVLPDGTELRIACESERLERCVEPLARVLATRTVGASALEAALARLRAARRGARADPGRTADALAIGVLLGDARGLDPLGAAEEDTRIDAEAIARWLADHWGPSRSLWIAVGDAPPGAVKAALARALAGAPRARRARAARRIEPRAGAAVAIGDVNVASAAIAVRSGAAGIAIARRVLDDIEDAIARVFPLRGGTIVVVRSSDARALAEGLAYARAIAPRGDEAPVDRDDPIAIAERLGASWVARTEDALPPEGGLGIGAVLAGGRGDADLDDPDVPARRAALALLEPLARELEGLGRAGVLGDADEQRAALWSPHGARAIAQREPIGTVAIALAIEAPAVVEPASLHGRRALLARLLERCVALRVAGAVASWSDASSFGVVVESEPAAALETIDRAARCARDPGLGPLEVEQARARALAALGSAERRLALAARALAPGAPGLIAPAGTPEGLAAIDAAWLRAHWSAVATRDRARIAIVGDVAADRAARVALLGLSRLPPGSGAVPRAAIAPASEEILPARAEDDSVEVLLALRDRAPRGRGAGPGARAAASALASALSRRALAIAWMDAGADEHGSWLALAIRCDEAAVAAMPARLERARAEASAVLRDALGSELARASEEWARGSATASELARRLATEREGDAPDAAASEATARALLGAPARWVIARPVPAWRAGRRGVAVGR